MNEKIKKADELMHQGKSSKAVAMLKEAAKEEPSNPYGYYLLGVARMKCGRFFLAKEALEKADQLLPHHADNLRSLGWVKVMLGQIDEARENLREAINLDLLNPLSYIDLAMSYLHYFDFKQGMEWLRRAQALSPKHPYVLENVKMAKEMQKESLRYSEKEIKKMKKRKLDPEVQRAFRMDILQHYFSAKPLTKDEAEEVRQEARRNGVSISIVPGRQEKEIVRAPGKTKSLKRKKILEQRKIIERELVELLKQTKSGFKLEDIKEVIYNEEDQDDLMKALAMFDRGQGMIELGNALELINDAWNYFPHKCLGGLCPMEKILDYQQKQKKR